MNVGFMGLGKLGLPCALAVEMRGHKVIGYDPSPSVKEILDTKKLPYKEIWAQDYLDKSNIKIKSVKELVEHSDIIFVPIQTPHGEKFEGTTRIPDDREDFDYSYLIDGLTELDYELFQQKKEMTVIVISTVLPGTIRRDIKPLLSEYTKLCYNPFFIAMGTTMEDFLRPEIILFGVDDEEAAKKAKKFYRTINHAPFYETTIENAELIKVAYNTFIGTKIAYVNTLMEMCHHLPNTNVDEVMNALKMCNKRIISDKYLSGGMGDGGGCHPRDNIALSWLSDELGLRFNWFDNIMKQREVQTEWLVDMIEKESNGLPITILGKSFKPQTNITTGSPSILLFNILRERGLSATMYDPYIDEPFGDWQDMSEYDGLPQCYFIGTKHEDFVNFPFDDESIIIDPWRFIPDKEGCKVIRIGDNN
jgi:UDPglucose 6-dehydrogenase